MKFKKILTVLSGLLLAGGSATFAQTTTASPTTPGQSSWRTGTAGTSWGSPNGQPGTLGGGRRHHRRRHHHHRGAGLQNGQLQQAEQQRHTDRQALHTAWSSYSKDRRTLRADRAQYRADRNSGNTAALQADRQRLQTDRQAAQSDRQSVWGDQQKVWADDQAIRQDRATLNGTTRTPGSGWATGTTPSQPPTPQTQPATTP